MKKILSIALLLLTVTVSAQMTSRKTLAKEGIFEVMESIKNTDTMVYYYFSFQNQKYQYISDLGSILLNKKDDVKELSQGLLKLATHEEKISITIENKSFSISIYDFSNNVYLSDKNGKYTTMSKKQAMKLSESLLSYIDLLRL